MQSQNEKLQESRENQFFSSQNHMLQGKNLPIKNLPIYRHPSRDPSLPLPFSSSGLLPHLGRDVLPTDISISHIPEDRVEVDILLGGCVTQEEVQNTIHVFIHDAHKLLEATEVLEQENCCTGPRTLKRKQCKVTINRPISINRPIPTTWDFSLWWALVKSQLS